LRTPRENRKNKRKTTIQKCSTEGERRKKEKNNVEDTKKVLKGFKKHLAIF